jgi:protein phosphatase
MTPIDARRIALLSDMHGNAAAFRAVLAQIEPSDYDVVALGGDYVAHGPRPAETLALCRDLNAPAILGNTDVHVFERAERGTRWTADRLSPSDLGWLAARPFSQRFRAVPGDENSDLLLVHANPTNLNAVLICQEHPLGSFPLTTDTRARELLGDVRADLVVFGHVHFDSQGVLAGQRLASVGSVGLPYDGDHRAAWAVLEWDGNHWQIDHRRVEYDWRPVAAELDNCGSPMAALIAQRVRTARFGSPAT